MKLNLKYFIIAAIFLAGCSRGIEPEQWIGLTLIPPTTVTDKVELDIRAGIRNMGDRQAKARVSIYLGGENEDGLLLREDIVVPAGGSECVGLRIGTADKVGRNDILLVVETGSKRYSESKQIEVIASDIRSTRTIDGAWTSLYCWSETEGKHWNRDIEKLSDEQWRQIIRSMHKLGMDIVVVQELFSSPWYVGKHELTPDNYDCKAYYPSKLYPARTHIAAADAMEAILSEADLLGMHVFPAVGLYAWFDFSPGSLEWHKRVAGELWDMYGHHPSFYGFYVSEEIHGSLDALEPEEELRDLRKMEIVDFFAEFSSFCRGLAPSKPVMLASNSMGIMSAIETYPALLANLDILCPFGFARMPAGDLTGKEAADTLQKLCDEAGSHLWFDLEAFLFNPDGSLYPRDIEGIIGDLTLLDNFEKVLCYQYPGVFNDPGAGFRVGEEKTVGLFESYRRYLESVKEERE